MATDSSGQTATDHWNANQAMADSWNKPVISPVLMGRAEEVAALDDLMAQVETGQVLFQVVVVTGEAGIGKSRLMAEVKGRAEQRNFHILQGNCYESDQALPYAPILDLLRLFCARGSAEAIRYHLEPVAAQLVKLLPELTPLLPNLLPAPTLPPEQEKHALFQTLGQFILGVAVKRPLLLIVEDLHWSDDTSLEFLLHLLRHVESQPVLLLLTGRNDQSAPSLDHFLAKAVRRRLATEMALSPLSPAEVNQMIATIFDLPRPVHAEFLDTLYALTEGNPFFVEEILKALLATGQIFYADGRWDRRPMSQLQIPHTIQLAVQGRVKQLSPAAREALVLAAVAGRRFDFSLLQALLQQTERELLALLKEMIGVQLVIEESAEQFSFRHALTREAIYSGLLARERQLLHRLVAETLEELDTGSPDVRPANLAVHYYEAGVWQKALAYARQAGERAQALYTPRAAVTQFTRALEAANFLGIAPAAHLYRARAQAYETLGDFKAAEADYTAALQVAREESQTQAEWQALLDLGLLWASRDYQLAGDYFQQALALARRLEEPATVAHTLNRLGNWHMNVGQPLPAKGYHREALAIFEELNNRQGLAETLDLLGMTLSVAGDLIEAHSCYQRAIALQRSLGDRQGLASTLSSLSGCAGFYESDTLVTAVSLPEATAYAERGLRAAREIGWRAGEAYALICLSYTLGSHGEYGRALEIAQAALDLADDIEHRQWIVAGHCNLGLLHLDLFSLATAQSYLEEAHSLARETGSFIWIYETAAFLATVYIYQRQFAQAETILNEHLETAVTAWPTLDAAMPVSLRILWTAGAELALARRRPRLALAIIEQLAALAPNASSERQGIIPRLEHLRGEALTILNRLEEAEAAFVAAQASAVYQGIRRQLWPIHAGLGRLYRRQRRSAEADEQFAAARDLIDSLAATVPDESLGRQFQQKALATLPAAASLTSRRAARQEFEGLTPRERDVAALVSQGLSNRDIAGQLVLSERTVEKHVSNILSKLNFTSRAQIAAWAVQKGLIQAS
jgi:DNA-binding CsgD family transcriptional regulator/tetratricopeptide (TPR) repeat protein